MTPMWNFLKKLARNVWRFLALKNMPLGISLLLFFATAWGTYSLAPKLNQTFENQKIVTAYIISNLNDFNLLSRELVSEVSIFNNTLQKEKHVDTDSLDKIRAKITELQWRALELDIIFDDDVSLEKIKAYKKSLSDLGFAVDTATVSGDSIKISRSVVPFANNSLTVISILAQKAGLKVEQANMLTTVSE